jgi:hypothetical protein
MGTRSRDLPPCSIVPQPTTLPRAPYDTAQGINFETVNNLKSSFFWEITSRSLLKVSPQSQGTSLAKDQHESGKKVKLSLCLPN